MEISKLKTINNIAILGYGKEGKSTLSFLLSMGISKDSITVLDQNTHKLEGGIKCVFGDNYLDELGKYELIFKSPGISPYNKKIAQHRDKLTSQSQVFFDNYEGRVIGVTATKGKSTVSTLIYKTLKNAGYNVKLVGNIGNPVLEEIDLFSDEKYNYVIYELSSYMLETLEPTCDIGVFGNLYTCHLDWHNNDFEVYKKAKTNLLKYSDYIVLSDEFKELNIKGKEIKYFGKKSKYSYDNENFYIGNDIIFTSEKILLPGEHNKKNICSVIAILSFIVEKYNHNSTWIFTKLLKSLELTLEEFGGLPHRLENIGTYKGITFIDDGISTTPESTVEAIKTYGKSVNCLFLGGADYGFTNESYKLLKDSIVENNVNKIVFFPTTGLDVFGIKTKDNINGAEFEFSYNDLLITAIYTDNMETAVKFTYKHLDNGICLMSCAAPSYSVWSGYEEKGKLFKEAILKNKDS